MVSVAVAICGARTEAAVISIVPSDATATVTVDGTLTPDDGDQFRAKTNALTKAVVVLNSDGGSVTAGIMIGEAIRLKGFHSVVVGRCVSACALAWLGGTPRSMVAGAEIGFHAAYNPNTGQETAVGNAVVGAYLTKIGLPYEAVIYVIKAPPKSVSWLTSSEAKQRGIDVTLVDKSTILAGVPTSVVLPQSRHESSPSSDTDQPGVKHKAPPATARVVQNLLLALLYDRNCSASLAEETKAYIRSVNNQAAIDYVNKQTSGMTRSQFCSQARRSELPNYIGRLNAEHAPPPPKPSEPKPRRDTDPLPLVDPTLELKLDPYRPTCTFMFFGLFVSCS